LKCKDSREVLFVYIIAVIPRRYKPMWRFGQPRNAEPITDSSELQLRVTFFCHRFECLNSYDKSCEKYTHTPGQNSPSRQHHIRRSRPLYSLVGLQSTLSGSHPLPTIVLHTPDTRQSKSSRASAARCSGRQELIQRYVLAYRSSQLTVDPLTRYRHLVKVGTLKADPRQEVIIHQLQRLWEDLQTYDPGPVPPPATDITPSFVSSPCPPPD
jgi:hypothetical protein